MTQNAFIADVENGGFVSQKHQRIAEIVHDFDPNLQLCYIPESKRESYEEQKWPFVILHRAPGREPYLVMLLEEDELDERVIERLFLANVDKNDVLGQMRAKNDAKKVLEMKKQKDEFMERMDFDLFRIQTKKNYVKHNGKTYEA